MKTETTLLAAKEWRKTITKDRHGQPYCPTKTGNTLPAIITARAELIHRHPNAQPHFSITGEVFNPRTRRRWGKDYGTITAGAIHEEIAHHFPQCAPLIAGHLSTIDGIPMYAAENGAYWLGLTSEKPDHDLAGAQKLWRTTPEKTQEIAEYIWNYYGDNAGAYDKITTAAGAIRETFTEFGLWQKWHSQAAEMLALLNPTEHLAKYAQQAEQATV